MYSVFESVSVGPLTARNRIIRSATWLGLADRDGGVTPELLRRYAALSEGGAAILFTGYASVSPEGRQLPGMLGAHDDSLVPGLRRLVEAVRVGGGLIGLQLAHAGGQTRSEWTGSRSPVAPSFVPHALYAEMPRELTEGEIARIVLDFGRAARRAREAGFDLVQIHAAHGLLVNQFLSSATNMRSDRYGGDLRRRFRFLSEVIAAVQAAAGPDFPVAVELGGADFLPGGLEIEDACRVAEWAAMRGLCLIEVTGGTAVSGALGPSRDGVAPGRGEAYFRDLARAVKRRVACPVSIVGGLRSPGTLDDLLIEGVADFFGLSRPLICEPDLPRRWQGGDRAPAACGGCDRCRDLERAARGVFLPLVEDDRREGDPCRRGLNRQG